VWNTKKATQDLLQEEIFRERAATLARAGEHLAEALEKLQGMESDIKEGMAVRHAWGKKESADWKAARVSDEAAQDSETRESGDRRRFLSELNEKIRSYNQQRENVRTRFYYLIVIREALGMTHHQRLEDFYPIPPKKQCLPEG
jgi:hypothetical protein